MHIMQPPCHICHTYMACITLSCSWPIVLLYFSTARHHPEVSMPWGNSTPGSHHSTSPLQAFRVHAACRQDSCCISCVWDHHTCVLAQQEMVPDRYVKLTLQCYTCAVWVLCLQLPHAIQCIQCTLCVPSTSMLQHKGVDDTVSMLS